jgi:hypothetical protein
MSPIGQQSSQIFYPLPSRFNAIYRLERFGLGRRDIARVGGVITQLLYAL